MKTTACVGFVSGKSGTGKTTLLVEVVRILRERGYRVGTIKHARHEVHIDREGSDSWRHARAGSEVVVLAGPGLLATLRKSVRPTLADALTEASAGTDIVLVEGFKDDHLPKIEIYRSGYSEELLFMVPQSEDTGIIAVATDIPLDVAVPVLPLDDPEKVCDFIVERFLNDCTGV